MTEIENNKIATLIMDILSPESKDLGLSDTNRADLIYNNYLVEMDHDRSLKDFIISSFGKDKDNTLINQVFDFVAAGKIAQEDGFRIADKLVKENCADFTENSPFGTDAEAHYYAYILNEINQGTSYNAGVYGDIRDYLNQTYKQDNTDAFNATYTILEDGIKQQIQGKEEPTLGIRLLNLDTSDKAWEIARDIDVTKPKPYQKILDYLNKLQAKDEAQLHALQTAMHQIYEDDPMHPICDEIEKITAGNNGKITLDQMTKIWKEVYNNTSGEWKRNYKAISDAITLTAATQEKKDYHNTNGTFKDIVDSIAANLKKEFENAKEELVHDLTSHLVKDNVTKQHNAYTRTQMIRMTAEAFEVFDPGRAKKNKERAENIIKSLRGSHDFKNNALLWSNMNPSEKKKSLKNILEIINGSEAYSDTPLKMHKDTEYAKVQINFEDDLDGDVAQSNHITNSLNLTPKACDTDLAFAIATCCHELNHLENHRFYEQHGLTFNKNGTASPDKDFNTFWDDKNRALTLSANYFRYPDDIRKSYTRYSGLPIEIDCFNLQYYVQKGVDELLKELKEKEKTQETTNKIAQLRGLAPKDDTKTPAQKIDKPINQTVASTVVSGKGGRT